MKKMGKRRLIAGILVLVMLTVPGLGVNATSDTREKLENAKEEREATENQKNAQEENITNMEEAQSGLEGELNSLNSQLAEVSNNLEEIENNIIAKNEEIATTQAELEDACRKASVHDFILSLPKGYDTVLDDKANLSAGQKQLVTIARAMIENAPMLILDEATSSVDTRTEELIQKAMDQLTVGRTSFIIAHRLSTIRNADLILVMKDGDIIEKGSHEQLLSQNGFYAELYNSQFEQA